MQAALRNVTYVAQGAANTSDTLFVSVTRAGTSQVANGSVSLRLFAEPVVSAPLFLSTTEDVSLTFQVTALFDGTFMTICRFAG